MTKPTNLAKGMFAACNNQYHGVKSIAEFGAIAHANSLAKVLIQERMVATEEEALSLANFEVQRLKWNEHDFQSNRIARDKLQYEKAIRDKQQLNQGKMIGNLSVKGA